MWHHRRAARERVLRSASPRSSWKGPGERGRRGGGVDALVLVARVCAGRAQGAAASAPAAALDGEGASVDGAGEGTVETGQDEAGGVEAGPVEAVVQVDGGGRAAGQPWMSVWEGRGGERGRVGKRRLSIVEASKRESGRRVGDRRMERSSTSVGGEGIVCGEDMVAVVGGVDLGGAG